MRWILRIALVLAAAIVVAAAGGYVYMRGSLPQLSGTIAVAGIDAPVQIVRDRHGIPHILAHSRNDAYFGLGFAHAQDRLWQMEINRRTAAARLSELFGDSTVDTDKFLRTLGIRRSAGRTLEHLSADVRRGLDAYAAGVNAFLATRSGPLPPEFLVFGVEPEAWTPADSLGWGKMMAWDLGGNWSNELARMRLANRLTPQQLAEFFPPYPGDAPVSLADLRSLYRAAAGAIDLAALTTRAPIAPEGLGSNNWVLRGSATATGKPLLANDPHLGLAAPAVWYFAHLSAPGLEVIGATLPGVPGIVLGRNQRIAWGFTNTGPDTQDLFLEMVDPADPGRYMTPSGPAAFERREEIIRVRGSDPITLQVRATRHGPVISDVAKSVGQAMAPGFAIAFAWTTLRDDDLTAQALMGMSAAHDWPSFVAALRDFHSPQQNIVYADIDGNIGFIAPGRVPVRRADNDLKGLAPAPGWDARYDWSGFVPFDELPRAYNPAKGRIATANHKIVPDSYPHYITSEWTEPYRAARIEEMLAARKVHSVASFREMQADVASAMARDFLPLLLAAPPAGERERAGRDLLARWDGAMAGSRPEPLIFQAWYRELTRLVYADELGKDFESLWRPRPLFLFNVLSDRDGQSRWCDDVTTPATENCPEMVGRALGRALADLDRRYGADMGRWRWDEAHTAVSDHKPFSKIAVLRHLFEVRVPTPGDAYSVNVGRNDIRNEAAPFLNLHAASLRAIYDLGDLDNSLFIHSTGQSGNVLSPLYDNFAAPWANVEYLPMTTRRDAFETGALGTLTLRPR
jgi:penicillin amidase